MGYLNNLYISDKAGLLMLAGFLLFAAALPFSPVLMKAGVFLLVAGGLLGLNRQSSAANILPAVTGNPLFLPWMIYLAAAILAALAGVSPAGSLSVFKADAMRYLAFAGLCLFLTLKKERLIVSAYLLAISLAALIGILRSITGLLSGLDVRATAFQSPVTFGELMVIGFTCAACFIFCGRAAEKRTRIVAYACALLSIAAIVLSQTRGAYLGFLAALCTLFILKPREKNRLIFFLCAACALQAVFSYFNPALKYRVISLGKQLNSAVTSTGRTTDIAINVRFELWKTGLAIIQDRPFFGVGAANVKKTFHSYHPEALEGEENRDSLHSLYIHQAAERGLIGLGALLLLFGAMLRLALKNSASNAGSMALWAPAVLPAFFIMNLTEISFQHAETSFALCLALAISINSGKSGSLPQTEQ